MKRKKALIVTKGGLGNQLFQLSIARYLQEVRNMEVRHLELHLPKKLTVGRDGIDVWPSYVGELAPENRIIAPMRSKIGRRIVSVSLTLDTLLGGILRKAGFGTSQWVNHDLSADLFDVSLSKGPRWVNFSGASLVAAKEAKTWLTEKVDQSCTKDAGFLNWRTLAESEKPIMVHWRRGDYKGLEHIFGELDAAYYMRGIIALRTENQPVWLFTDAVEDESIALKRLIGADVLIDNLVDLSPLCTLRLLSLHNGLVCSNSSFSWWASFMSTSPKIQTPAEILHTSQNIFRELGEV